MQRFISMARPVFFSPYVWSWGSAIMRGVLRLGIFPLLAALGGCGDTEYKGNVLLTDPAGLSARLVPGVTREAEVSTLLSGSETEQHAYGAIGPDGQFVGCAQNDQEASEKCPFVQRQYITLRKRTGRFLIPNQTDAWRALLVFDGAGVLRAARQDYFEGPWDWFGIR
jgi:hypothetical protein